MRGVTKTIVGLALLAAGCSADLDVEVLDSQGNPTVVTVNGDTTVASGAASEGARGADAEDPADATVTADETPTATPTPASSDASGEATPTPAPTVGGADTATPTVSATPTPAAADPTPTPESSSGDTSTPTATPSPTPTAVLTATPTPTPTPEPIEIEFVIAPNAALLGVDIGSDTTEAMEALESLIGEPDFDSGWYVGCPLDGDGLDERLVQWGDLNVYFDRSDGDEIMRAWGYDLRIVDGGYPELELIELPGGSQMGDPVNEVAAAAGLEVVYDALFDINRVGEDGYEILSDAPPGAPVWGAFVPFIPTCE